MALDRVGDADAADQKCGEADQRQELGEAADGALELRRGAAAADPPAGLPAGRPRAVDQLGRGAIVGRIVRQFAADPAHQAAGLQQSGGAQALLADQNARAEPDIAGELVRFGRPLRIWNVALPIAMRSPLRDRVAPAGWTTAAPKRGRCILALGQQIRHRHFGIERHLPEHRVVAVHGLEFDQRQLAVTACAP